jgi:alpha-galactosidase
VRNIWTGETTENTTGVFEIDGIKACDNLTIIATPIF